MKPGPAPRPHVAARPRARRPEAAGPSVPPYARPRAAAARPRRATRPVIGDPPARGGGAGRGGGYAAPASIRAPIHSSTASGVRGSAEDIRWALFGRDDEVVLDADADAAQFRRQGEVVGLEVQARFDGEDLAGLQDAVEVGVGPGVGAVVDVQAQHVAAGAEGVAAVQVALGVLQYAPLGEALRDDSHGGLVEVAEPGARPQRRDPRLLRGEHQLVHLALDGEKRPDRGSVRVMSAV